MQRFDVHCLVEFGPIPLSLITMSLEISEGDSLLRAIPCVPKFSIFDSEEEINRSGRRRVSVVMPIKGVSSLIVRELKRFRRCHNNGKYCIA